VSARKKGDHGAFDNLLLTDDYLSDFGAERRVRISKRFYGLFSFHGLDQLIGFEPLA
jgi:hypothetical protein